MIFNPNKFEVTLILKRQDSLSKVKCTVQNINFPGMISSVSVTKSTGNWNFFV